MKNIFFYIFLAGSLLCYSCKKIPKDDVEPYKGKNYFPTNTGHELIYDVEQITINTATGLRDTSSYKIKEIIAGKFADSLGRETQKIERYVKNDTIPSFILYKTWSGNLLTSTAQRVEDNIRYLKLSFPMAPNLVWNGNSLNSLPGRDYKYTSVHQPLTLGSLNFDSTCVVLQYKDSSSLNADYSLEKYATGIGMIYKINQDINFTGGGTDTIGTIYRETLISFVK